MLGLEQVEAYERPPQIVKASTPAGGAHSLRRGWRTCAGRGRPDRRRAAALTPQCRNPQCRNDRPAALTPGCCLAEERRSRPAGQPRSGADSRRLLQRRADAAAGARDDTAGPRPLRKPGLARALCLRSWQSSSASVSRPTTWRLAAPAAERTFGRQGDSATGGDERIKAIARILAGGRSASPGPSSKQGGSTSYMRCSWGPGDRRAVLSADQRLRA